MVSESPTNPHLSVVDIERFAAIGTQARRRDAHRRHARPRPTTSARLASGVDYVLHSCTKYLAGHNDLLAGVVIGSEEKIEPLRKLRGIMGSINTPAQRLSAGPRPEDLRAADAAAQRQRPGGGRVPGRPIPRVERVYYPGLPSHPYYEIARRTMRGCGGLVTFQVKDADWRQTADVVDAVRIPRIAPSLGGVESLIEQPLVMSYFEFTPEQRQAMGILRQHDPAVLRHRERGRPDRRPGPGAVGPLA